MPFRSPQEGRQDGSIGKGTCRLMMPVWLPEFHPWNPSKSVKHYFMFILFSFCFETGFLSVALAVLELSL